MYKFFCLTISAFLFSCNQPQYKNPHILINTQFGDIEIELYPDKSPKTVKAFLSYVDSGYYNKSSFYRVLKAEELPTDNNSGIIQGGIWQTNPGKKVLLAGIEHESTKLTGLTHESGTISLARTTPGSANTEFFICIGNQNSFDFGNAETADRLGFAAFGKVFKGMPVVRKIQNQKNNGDKFVEKIGIYKISKL